MPNETEGKKGLEDAQPEAHGVSGVYFALLAEKVVKIGSSGNIEQRLAGIPVLGGLASPKLLALIPVENDAAKLRELEYDTQEKFAQDWLDIPGTQELFRLSDRLLKHINQIRTEKNHLPTWGGGSRGALPRFHVRYHPRPADLKEILGNLPLEYQICCANLLALRVTTQEHLILRREELFEWLHNPNRAAVPWTAEKLKESLWEYAVQPPQLLLAILENPETYRKLCTANETVVKTDVWPTLTEFCAQVLQEMGTLPPAPQEEDLAELEKSLSHIKKSFLVAYRVFHLIAKARGEASGYASVRKAFYDHEEYKLYARLSSWVYRRSQKGWMKAAAYQPPRPEKSSEADRKRAAYWRKKGLSQPPTKRKYQTTRKEGSDTTPGQEAEASEDFTPLDVT